MNKSLFHVSWVVLLLVVLGFIPASGAVSENAPTPQRSPIEVHLSQAAEPTPLWFRVLDKLTWPLLMALAALIFRKPLSGMVNNFATKGGEFSLGGLELRLPALESELKAQSETISDQQGRIDEQSERIRNLIRFSMSIYIYKMLCDLTRSKDGGRQYIYRKDGSMERNLRFLIDHGYIEEVPHWPVDGEDISSLVTITPSGDDVIALRGDTRG